MARTWRSRDGKESLPAFQGEGSEWARAWKSRHGAIWKTARPARDGMRLHGGLPEGQGRKRVLWAGKGQRKTYKENKAIGESINP